MNAREAAFLAHLTALNSKSYSSDVLNEWKKLNNVSIEDFRLAQHIAFGSIQMQATLDYLATKLCTHLPAKKKEKVLLRQALYQYYFLQKIPLHAIVNETIKIAKKHCHHTFAHFLNAVLRKVHTLPLSLPEDLSIRYSVPKLFVDLLQQEYGEEKTEQILDISNQPPMHMARLRSSQIPENCAMLCHEPLQMVVGDNLLSLAESSAIYIQNRTPGTLFATLAKDLPSPSSILDLCASPGGKLLLAHDFFPTAQLYANDVSPERMRKLLQNCQKYSLNATISCSKGEEYASTQKFDLIILDVPCSNSGVLNKRPEARWRITEEALLELDALQRKLALHALSLLSDKGELWYMTCSILRQENENFIQWLCANTKAAIRKECKILPNSQGYDGGYACALTIRST